MKIECLPTNVPSVPDKGIAKNAGGGEGADTFSTVMDEAVTANQGPADESRPSGQSGTNPAAPGKGTSKPAKSSASGDSEACAGAGAACHVYGTRERRPPGCQRPSRSPQPCIMIPDRLTQNPALMLPCRWRAAIFANLRPMRARAAHRAFPCKTLLNCSLSPLRLFLRMTLSRVPFPRRLRSPQVS